MKQLFKRVLLSLMLVMTFCMFSGMEAKAAGTFNAAAVTKVSDDSATITWGYTGSEHYFNIYLSIDGINYAYKDYGMSGSDTLYNLSPNTTYFAKIYASEKSGASAAPVAISQPFSFTTLPSEPAKPTGLTFTASTDTSVSLAWTPVAGATGYEVNVYNNGVYTPLMNVATPSATVTNLAANSSFTFRVRAYAQNAAGTVYSYYDDSYGTNAKTLPAKVPTLGVTSLFSNINVVYFGWSKVNADGYEFQIYNSNGKLIHSAFTNPDYRVNLKLGSFCKYRVRGYVNIGAAKAFGAWSDYKFIGVPSSSSAKVYRSSRKIKYTWKKVSGATKYTVYISTKSATAGYKKVKTLKPSKRSITITKYGKKRLKKGKTYYVKVVVTGKSGGTKATSTNYAYVKCQL